MLVKVFNDIALTGVEKTEDVVSDDKLPTRNKFALFCSLCCFLFALYFFTKGYFIPGIWMIFGAILFVFSITFNYFREYLISCGLLAVSTNFSVISTTMFFGISSGFHLYLVLSPIILYILFEKKSRLFIFFASLLYFASLVFIVFFNNHEVSNLYQLDKHTSNLFYFLNFTLTTLLLLLLLFYFTSQNKKTNRIIRLKNDILKKQYQELQTEIETRKEAENELKSLLKEKDIWLGEINHRIKNNLSVVSTLLELQTGKTQDAQLLKIVKDSQQKIRAIAIVYELLYKGKKLDKLDFKQLVEELTAYLPFAFHTENILIIKNIESFEVSTKDAITLALLLIELITNSIKHAFHNIERGQIEISAHKSDYFVIFEYKDNGPGFEQEQEMEKDDKVGLSIIDAFIMQLDAEVYMETQNEFHFVMKFKPNFKLIS